MMIILLHIPQITATYTECVCQLDNVFFKKSLIDISNISPRKLINDLKVIRTQLVKQVELFVGYFSQAIKLMLLNPFV